MLEFKSKEEYEKWKAEKLKITKEKGIGEKSPYQTEPKNPQPKRIKKSVLLFIASIIVVLIGISFLCISQLNKTTAISGGAWIIKGGGQSDILRGLEIALCNEDVKSRLKDVIDSEWHKIEMRYKDYKYITPDKYDRLNPEIMNIAVAPFVLKVAITDVDGKYTINGVPKGLYYVYAVYKSSFSVAYWLIPVQVENSKSIKIDIYNANAEEIHNKKPD